MPIILLAQESNINNDIFWNTTNGSSIYSQGGGIFKFKDPSTGKGRNKIYISELGIKDGLIGLLDCTQVYKGEGREGNCMFKYKGKYYLCSSNLYGWDASLVYYLVADSIKGQYLPTNEMLVMPGCALDYAHVTQTGFFYTYKINHQETVFYCGDRWADFAGNGLGYNQWVPLSFNNKTPIFNSLSAIIKNETKFNTLEMYALSIGKKYKSDFNNEHTNFTTISIKNIKVQNGKVEIGFYAEGNENAACFIDDVSLIIEH